MRPQRILAAVATLCCTSCGNPHGIYPVTGTVKYQGEPAVGACVFLVRQGTNPALEQTMMGVVQPDGSFSVDCGSLGKGAPPGEYIILIRWKYEPNLPAARSPSAAAARRDRLGGKYADPAHPLLRAVIRAQTNILPPLELGE